MLITPCALWMSLLCKCVLKGTCVIINVIKLSLFPCTVHLHRLASPIIPEDWEQECGITSGASGPDPSTIEFGWVGRDERVLSHDCEHFDLTAIIVLNL